MLTRNGLNSHVAILKIYNIVFLHCVFCKHFKSTFSEKSDFHYITDINVSVFMMYNEKSNVLFA